MTESNLYIFRRRLFRSVRVCNVTGTLYGNFGDGPYWHPRSLEGHFRRPTTGCLSFLQPAGYIFSLSRQPLLSAGSVAYSSSFAPHRANAREHDAEYPSTAPRRYYERGSHSRALLHSIRGSGGYRCVACHRGSSYQRQERHAQEAQSRTNVCHYAWQAPSFHYQ